MDEITRLNVLGDLRRCMAKHHPYSFWLLVYASNMQRGGILH
ncbi:hypothetical protein KUC_3776 [Vreelandella boliviensis LC1]|uniref:Uncharacterized protein n=1 Tax=Vreelandella boliviensis LC1 TaxID=1072583 RepID=A0A7U9GER0_9GAMM|nr:hypothetical protein KUC_3776 [Halomonas boliviensis LC1]